MLGGKHACRHVREESNPSFSTVMANEGNEYVATIHCYSSRGKTKHEEPRRQHDRIQSQGVAPPHEGESGERQKRQKDAWKRDKYMLLDRMTLFTIEYAFANEAAKFCYVDGDSHSSG